MTQCTTKCFQEGNKHPLTLRAKHSTTSLPHYISINQNVKITYKFFLGKLLTTMSSMSAMAEWLASRTLDPRVLRSNPGLSVTSACVPGLNTLPQIACVFSDRTRKIVGPFYPDLYSVERLQHTAMLYLVGLLSRLGCLTSGIVNC